MTSKCILEMAFLKRVFFQSSYLNISHRLIITNNDRKMENSKFALSCSLLLSTCNKGASFLYHGVHSSESRSLPLFYALWFHVKICVVYYTYFIISWIYRGSADCCLCWVLWTYTEMRKSENARNVSPDNDSDCGSLIVLSVESSFAINTRTFHHLCCIIEWNDVSDEWL